MTATFYVPGTDTTKSWIGNDARMCLKVKATGARIDTDTTQYQFQFWICGEYAETWWSYYDNTIRIVITNNNKTSESCTHYITQNNSQGILGTNQYSPMGTDYHEAGYCTLNVTSKNTNNVSLKFTFERQASGGTEGVSTTNWYANNGSGSVTKSFTAEPQITDTTYNIDYYLGDNGQFSTYGINGLRSANGGMQACNPTTARVGKPPNYAGVTTTSSWFYIETPTREGYTFNGWKVTGMDTTTHHYYAGSDKTSTATSWENTFNAGKAHEFYNLRGSAGTVTFVANWTATTYTVIYNSNGGTGSIENQSCNYGVPFQLQPNGFTKEGYTFLGWTNLLTPALNGEIRWTPGQTASDTALVINHGTCIIYAVWKKNPTLAVNNTDWQHINGVWVQHGEEWKKAIGIQVQSGGQWAPALEIPDLPS